MSEQISLAEAARRAGVAPDTLKRWAKEKLVPVRRGRWTAPAAAQARVIARLRERGHSLAELRRAAREGKLAYGYIEDLFPPGERTITLDEAARRSGIEPSLIQRLMDLIGTPAGREERYSEQDVEALQYMASVLAAGFPLVAFLQIVRVYAQSVRRMADAEARLFHLYIHEPLMRDGVPALEMAEEMEELAAELLPLSEPLAGYLHRRYLRHFVEQDVVGHMETDLAGGQGKLDRVQMAFSFVDLAGFVRYTEEEGEEEALDLVERFVETAEATLPPEATIVKTIGDEVMIVSPHPASLTEWTVGFLSLFADRPRPRAGIHYGWAVYRDGDYFGGDVNMAARVVARAQGGELLVTEPLVEAVREDVEDHIEFDPIGQVGLKGFPEPIPLLVARQARD